MSIAIVDNAYAGYLAGPTSITLTTAWQRFKITGTGKVLCRGAGRRHWLEKKSSKRRRERRGIGPQPVIKQKRDVKIAPEDL